MSAIDSQPALAPRVSFGGEPPHFVRREALNHAMRVRVEGEDMADTLRRAEHILAWLTAAPSTAPAAEPSASSAPR